MNDVYQKFPGPDFAANVKFTNDDYGIFVRNSTMELVLRDGHIILKRDGSVKDLAPVEIGLWYKLCVTENNVSATPIPKDPLAGKVVKFKKSRRGTFWHVWAGSWPNYSLVTLNGKRHRNATGTQIELAYPEEQNG